MSHKKQTKCHAFEFIPLLNENGEIKMNIERALEWVLILEIHKECPTFLKENQVCLIEQLIFDDLEQGFNIPLVGNTKQ